MSSSLDSVANVDEQSTETTSSATTGSEDGNLIATNTGKDMRRNDIYIDVIKNFQDFARLAEQWNSVYNADPEAQFFLSWTWLSACLKDSSQWFILSAKTNNNADSSPVAFFPLRLRMNKTKEGEVRKEIAMAGNRRADYTGFICLPEFQDIAIPAFARYLKRFNWDSLFLENILASDERTRLFIKNFPAGNYDSKWIKLIDKRDNIDNYTCPYVDLPDDWEDYLGSGLGSNTRYKIRRFLRKIDNSEELRVTHATPETINNDIDILIRFWESKWKARKGEWSDHIVHFFRKMLMHCFESGALFLPILWKDERPLGAVASLVDAKNRSLLFYVGGRDETVSNPPPGFVLHAYSIRYAINNGFKTYDFLRGNEPYKYLFGPKERHIRYIIVNARERQNLAKSVDSASLPVRRSTDSTLRRHLLSPSPEERARTHVLFLARHALDSSPERKAKYGYHVTYHAILLNAIRELGLRVTPASEYEVLFGPLNFDFLYAIHSHAKFDGHELLASAVAAYRGIPCLGSSATTRAISEDKVLAKQVAASLGLDVAEHRIISPAVGDIAEFSLSGSWVLKPRGGIASEALAKVDNESDWNSALKMVSDPSNDGRDFIAEEFVPGLNLTVPIVEGFPRLSLAVFEERGRPGDNVVTHEGKRGLNSSYSSAPYEGPGAQEALEAAAKMAAEISPFDYARFDFRYDPDTRRLVFIEVNVACNMSPASAVYRSVELHGIKYEELVRHVLTYSLRRQRKQTVKKSAEAMA